MKHLTIALIFVLAGLVPYAYAQDSDGSTEAGSVRKSQDCDGTCMSSTSDSPSFVQRSPEGSVQMADDIYGKPKDGPGGTETFH